METSKRLEKCKSKQFILFVNNRVLFICQVYCRQVIDRGTGLAVNFPTHALVGALGAIHSSGSTVGRTFQNQHRALQMDHPSTGESLYHIVSISNQSCWKIAKNTKMGHCCILFKNNWMVTILQNCHQNRKKKSTYPAMLIQSQNWKIRSKWKVSRNPPILPCSSTASSLPCNGK